MSFLATSSPGTLFCPESEGPRFAHHFALVDGKKRNPGKRLFFSFSSEKSVMWKRARRSVKLHEVAYRLIGSFFATVLQVPKDFLGSIQFWFLHSLIGRLIRGAVL